MGNHNGQKCGSSCAECEIKKTTQRTQKLKDNPDYQIESGGGPDQRDQGYD